MPNGKALPPGEVVLRRFDPHDETRCTLDEAGKPARLRSSAFRWDPDPPDSPVRKECSVYHEAGLAALGLNALDCIESDRPHWRLAEATVLAVKRFTRSQRPDPNPFEVVEAPLHGDAERHPRDGAHACIVHSLPLAGADKWYRDLALAFRVRPEGGSASRQD